jgi:hypothetical protein
MRNRIVHAYFDVDLTIVWEVIQSDLPDLKAQVHLILQTLGELMAKYKKSSARYNRKVERSTMHALPAPIPTEHLREFCQKNHIRRLAVFGSALRSDFRPDGEI